MIIINAIVFIVVVLVVCSVDLSSITLDKPTERLLYDVGEDIDKQVVTEQEPSGEFEQVKEDIGLGMSGQVTESQSVLQQAIDSPPQHSEATQEQSQFTTNDFEEFGKDGDFNELFDNDDLDLHSTIDRNVSPESIINTVVSQKTSSPPVVGIDQVMKTLASNEKKNQKRVGQDETDSKPKSVGMKFNDTETYEDGDSMIDAVFNGGDES